MTNMFHRPVTARKSHGFTLVELLVALGIFATLMSGILVLFVGSIRTVNQGRQSINAHEMARGAQMVFQNDLVSGFTSRDHADVYNLVGTPVGMVFIGTSRGNATTSANAASVPGVARITYVIYKNNITNWVEPVAATSTNGTATMGMVDPIENIFSTTPFDPAIPPTLNGYPYKLIRFVEPGVSQLDEFPINWDFPLPNGVTLKDGTAVSAGWKLGDLFDHYFNPYRDYYSDTTSFPMPPLLDFCDTFAYPHPDLATLKRSLVIDFWLRMLAGGDTVVPVSAWWNENPNPKDYATPKTVPPYIADPSSPSATVLPIYNDMPTRMKLEARDYVLCESVASPIDFAKKNIDVFEESDTNVTTSYDSFKNQVFSYRSANVTYETPDFVPPWWNSPVLELLRLKEAWLLIAAPFEPINPADPAYLAAVADFKLNYIDPLRARVNATNANGLQNMRLPVTATMKLQLALQSRTTNAPDFNREFNVDVNIPSGYVRKGQVTPTP